MSLGPKCQVVCWDADSGAARWLIDLVFDYEATVPPWYAGQCPLIDAAADRLILAPGGKALLLAVDYRSGKVLWESPNPHGWAMTHASIAPMELAGRRMYVYCGKGGVAGVSADDGSILWETADWQIATATCPSPVILGDGRVFLTGGYNAGSLMLQVERQGDRLAARTLFRLTPRQFSSEQQTPIFWNGCLYGVRQKDERLVCLDADGKELWHSGPAKFGSAPYLIADGLIYAMSDDGACLMAEATAAGYRPLAQGAGDPGRRDLLGADGLGGGAIDRPRFHPHGLPRRRGEAAMSDQRKALACGFARVAVCRGVGRRHRRRRSSTASAATARTTPPTSSIIPKIDPALIAYEQTAAWTVGMKECRAMAVGPDDSIYVGGDRTIRGLRPDGTVLREIALDAPPQCLALPGSDAAEPGRMYVGMEDRVEVFDAQGKRIAAWKPLPAGAAISGIATAERDVFVADAGNRIVWRFDLSGRRLGRIGVANAKQKYPGFLVTSRCLPLSLGADGLLYVANPRALRVEAFTFAGDLEFSWGKGASGVEGFFGCCNPTCLAAMPDGRFLTLEKGVRRVKVYSAAGKFECVVAELVRAGDEPGPIAADHRGRVFVLDAAAGKVRVFERSPPSRKGKPHGGLSRFSPATSDVAAKMGLSPSAAEEGKGRPQA